MIWGIPFINASKWRSDNYGIRGFGERVLAMIENPIVAKDVGDLMQRIAHDLDESLLLVQRSCSSSEYEKYRNCVGGVLGAMFEIVYSIYREHPELKPPGLFEVNETDS